MVSHKNGQHPCHLVKVFLQICAITSPFNSPKLPSSPNNARERLVLALGMARSCFGTTSRLLRYGFG